jgi:hypothetical protein
MRITWGWDRAEQDQREREQRGGRSLVSFSGGQRKKKKNPRGRGRASSPRVAGRVAPCSACLSTVRLPLCAWCEVLFRGFGSVPLPPSAEGWAVAGGRTHAEQSRAEQRARGARQRAGATDRRERGTRATLALVRVHAAQCGSNSAETHCVFESTVGPLCSAPFVPCRQRQERERRNQKERE